MTSECAIKAGSTRKLVAPELLPTLDAFPQLDFTSTPLGVIRAGLDAIAALQPPPLAPALQAVRCEERLVPSLGGAPDVRLLLYTPAAEAATPRPAYLQIHAGGYVIGTPELDDAANRSTAAELGCVVASVDYRLAPETRFPGALEDCYAALKWLHDEADALGVDRDRIAVGGESAGAGLAAALAIHARDRGEAPIRLQLLDSPMIDDRTGSTADPHPHCGAFMWTAASNRFGWEALLGMKPGGPATPYGAAPAHVEDLSGLPPAFILVGALDLFLEESLEYARRLTRAGVSTELHAIPGAFHGFALAGDDAPQVAMMHRLRRDALGRAFREA
jgi:triacylglycerol lipase